jgi:hypothetical protein
MSSEHEGCKFPHLNLSRWPFRLVADPESGRIWADRDQLRVVLEEQLNKMRFEPSSIQLVWGWYGAGKTHSLYYLKHLCEKTDRIAVVYNEFPKNCASFLDLYRSFTAGLDIITLKKIYDGVLSAYRYDKDRIRSDTCTSMPDLLVCLDALSNGNPQAARVAQMWFQAQKVDLYTLRRNNYFERIESDEQAVRAIEALLSLLQTSKFERLVWMIDDFQKIVKRRETVKTAILDGLYSTFNRCPNRLSLYVSVTGVEAAKAIFPLDLLDRIDTANPIEVRLFTRGEAKEYVRQLLTVYRCPGLIAASEWFPFDEAAIDGAIAYLEDNSKPLKTRFINHVLGGVLQKYESAIKAGTITRVGAAEVKAVLNTPGFGLDESEAE